MARVAPKPRRQAADKPEATSLLGKPLYRPAVPEASRAKLEADVAAAFEMAKQEPSAEAIIWLGRRTAYLGKFREAIRVYTGGLQALSVGSADASPSRPSLRDGARTGHGAIADLQTAGGLIKGSRTRSSRTDSRTREGFRRARSTRTSGITSRSRGT